MKRILSGITPSGDGGLHRGNYPGAVVQFYVSAIDLTMSTDIYKHHRVRLRSSINDAEVSSYRESTEFAFGATELVIFEKRVVGIRHEERQSLLELS